MKTFFSALIVAINFAVLIYYCHQISCRKIRPALAMWLFFTIAVVGTLSTYLRESNFTYLDNILNSSDLLTTGFITIWIALFGDQSTRMSRFVLGCLLVVIVVMIFWALSRWHLVANLAIQLVLVIAYFPVIHRMWQEKRHHESYLAWGAMFFVACLSLLSDQGMLARIYAVRALVCIGPLLVLMWYTDRKARPGLIKEHISSPSANFPR